MLEICIREEKTHLHGHFERNKDAELSHLHKAIQEGLKAGKINWNDTPTMSSKYSTISSEVGALITSFETPFSPETRAERVVRLAAEAAAEEKGE